MHLSLCFCVKLLFRKTSLKWVQVAVRPCFREWPCARAQAHTRTHTHLSWSRTGNIKMQSHGQQLRKLGKAPKLCCAKAMRHLGPNSILSMSSAPLPILAADPLEVVRIDGVLVRKSEYQHLLGTNAGIGIALAN